jgi:hypothetical protein
MASPICRALPCRALTLIREYSRPTTRPDWRKSVPIISQYNLYLYVTNHILRNFRLKANLLRRIKKTDWYYIYTYIQKCGIDDYYCYVGYFDVLHMDGIKEAECDYQNSIMKYDDIYETRYLRR